MSSIQVDLIFSYTTPSSITQPVIIPYAPLQHGLTNVASGQRSHAEGVSTTASGSTSHAEGSNTVAGGTYAHAEGFQTKAYGQQSHTEGSGTITTGVGAHAEGGNTTANGGGSHSEGSSTIANGGHSHAEGSFTTTNGGGSHSEGSSTTTNGNYSHAEGSNTVANGVGAHTEGFNTIANGDYSHAEGRGTVTNGLYQHVSGKYNLSGNTTQAAFIIGNGTSDLSRSDLLIAVGNEVEIFGNTKTETIQVTNGATNGYVLTSDASGNGTWQSVAGGTDTYVTGTTFNGTDLGLGRNNGLPVLTTTLKRTLTANAGINPLVDNVEVIFCTSSTLSGGTITLSSNMNITGKQVDLIRVSTTSPISISAQSANINGSALPATLATTLYSKITCISDGTDWYCHRPTII